MFLKSFTSVALLFACLAGTVAAQGPSASIFRQEPPAASQGPLTLDNSSWTTTPPLPLPQIRIHDIVSIRVQEGAQMYAEGEVENRKNAGYKASLLDWVKLAGFDSLKPAPQVDGNPTVAGTLNSLYRTEGGVETRESLIFNIAAHVVDIRPNGNLILEARREIHNNSEIWDYALTGECRPTDIGPGNLILSRDIADLRIEKQERGIVPDGYGRGWFTRWLDRYQPF
ncbi:flagellar basal body L-ring protein FlgH [Lignipirellula cremea]|uniref:Flagellar L-ring protein n=1 Tax=Lignipirellula cremea TaxID=2528010 RepID=A0A518DR40_9BACT|nr:flagellar basal body L-ring protein FlgH [Lignipirellula cremea]QDU94308.1 Flagellar L-ring protein precursor [Lignipirellula cremea]